jgi:hypothetical protein
MTPAMKIHIITTLVFAMAWPAMGDQDAMQKHREGSEKVAIEQDELGADVQQLVMEQTIQPVIDLLAEVQEIMTEATDLLVEFETGGTTLAAQTEIIEKIHEAAKERQKQSGSGEAGGAMMDMLERMMGKKPGEGEGEGEGQGEGEGEGEGEGGEAGKGQTGDSDSANAREGGSSQEFTEERRVPKATGTAGRALPPEFRPALEAYNRGMQNLQQP